MSDILDSIKAYDIQTLQYRTKIAPQYIKALLERDFSKFSKVQFLGFVSILEREFGLNLDSYREEFLQFSGAKQEQTPEVEEFRVKKESISDKNSKKLLLIALIAAIIASFGLYKFLSSSAPKKSDVVLDDTLMKEAKAKIEIKKQNIIDKKAKESVKELNTTVVKDVDKVIQHTITILPKRRLWVGFIDMKSGKKTQDVIDSPYELNASKSWLIVFGHGYLNIQYDKELFKYSSRKKLWFMYEDGKLQKIDRAEFKRNNGAKAW